MMRHRQIVFGINNRRNICSVFFFTHEMVLELMDKYRLQSGTLRDGTLRECPVNASRHATGTVMRVGDSVSHTGPVHDEVSAIFSDMNLWCLC